MPFKSKAQARWMFARHPAMAKRWERETPGGIKRLPEHRARRKKAIDKIAARRARVLSAKP